MLMPVVYVQAVRDQTFGFDDQPVKLFGFRSDRNACPVLTGVDVEQHADTERRAGHCLGELLQRLFVIASDGEFNFGILSSESDCSADVRTDKAVGEKDIFNASFGEHFSFSKCCTLMPNNAAGQLQFDDLARLVSLAVRPQSGWIASNLDHVVQILLDHIAKHDESWRQNLTCISNPVAVVHEGLPLKKAW